jgi:hypothetical protein
MSRPLLGLLSALIVIWAAPAFAQNRSATAAAERAYQDVDFPNTQRLAQHALEAGGATRQETARLYVLLGISAAALGNAEEAKQRFVAALAIDPNLKLEKNLSPKIRDPYLEAQGFWSASSQRLLLDARPAGDEDHLIIRLTDPAALVARIELRAGRVGDDLPRTPTVLERAPISRFPLPELIRRGDYEYAVRALDGSGNVLAEYGTDSDPMIVRAAAHSPSPDYPTHFTPRAQSYLLPVALGLAGLGATAAGVVFHVQRERDAATWNGPSCEAPGLTRLAQCSSIDTRIEHNERLAIGFYAGGVALLTGSVIALVAGHGAAEPQRAAALDCAVTGPGVACAGRF